MNTLIKFFLLFLALTIASAVMIQDFGMEFGTISYWQTHGVFFLIFITLFPRLTLLVSSVASGGFLWWLAWLITPRFLVAYLATLAYWQTNPVLVVISWLVALGGESSEKSIVINRGQPFRTNFHTKRTVNINTATSSSSRANHPGQTIDAEFEVKSETNID